MKLAEVAVAPVEFVVAVAAAFFAGAADLFVAALVEFAADPVAADRHPQAAPAFDRKSLQGD